MGCERNFPQFVSITEYPFFFCWVRRHVGLQLLCVGIHVFFFAIYLQVVGNGWIDFRLNFGNVMMEGSGGRMEEESERRRIGKSERKMNKEGDTK